MASRLCLVLGGVRSGKSAFAESRVSALEQPVLYVATGVATDDEMAERIRRHQSSRPSGWSTLEEPVDLADAIAPALRGGTGSVIIDSVDVWVANLLMENQGQSKQEMETAALGHADRLLALIADASQGFVLVSSEVGLSLVPPEPLGRRFQDLLGTVNQRIAVAASEVFLVVAGIPNRIKPAASE